MRFKQAATGFTSVVLLATLAACSSGSKSGTGTPSGFSAGSTGSTGSTGSSSSSATTGSGSTITVGLMTDLSGPAVSSSDGGKAGAQAYIDYVNSQGGVNGHQLKMVTADTASTPTGALTAAQVLVQRDHVSAIMEVTPLFFGAETYLLKAGIPVFGNAVDGPEWYDSKSTNLFNASGIFDYHYSQDALGTLMKSLGATNCGAIGNAGIPSVQISAVGDMAACTDAGLTAKKYYNLQVPLASTDVGPLALQIKDSGVEGLVSLMGPSTSIALVQALNQLNVHLKAFVLTVGYGSALLSDKAAVSAAQGVVFATGTYPAETKNAATALRKQVLDKAGQASPPVAGLNYGYLDAVALVTGLKAAGANLSAESITTSTRAITGYDANGLLPTKYDFANFGSPSTVCNAYVQLKGNAFVPVNPTPICGSAKKVS